MKLCVIKIDRDSVCAADDVITHHYQFELEMSASVRAIFEHLSEKSYLPSVAGRAHTWDAITKGQVVAEFLANNNYPEESNTLSIPISGLINDGEVHVHFKYNSALY